MQTLNVGAGRSDAEYMATEEQRRIDLWTDVRSDANFFFWAAVLAILGTGILPLKLNFLVTIGAIDLLWFYGRSLGALFIVALYGAAVSWLLVLIGLGLAGRAGHRWAFWAGIVLYGADMIVLIMTFSIWSFGAHSFFVYKWFQGQNALKELRLPEK